MRRASKIAAAVGLLLLVTAGLWLLVAPGQLVKYPSDLDKTAVASGKFTLFLDPATATPLAQPQTIPLSISRHVYVVASTDSQATVRERSVERIGSLPQQTFDHQYVMDRTSLENEQSSDAYAYTAANTTDRSPDYAVNLPFGTGDGPYEIWKNEAGRSYTFRRQGPEVQRNGVTLIPLVGTLTDAPVESAYLDQLAGQKLPRELTAEQMAAQLKARGVDLNQLTTQILPKLTPAEQSTLQSALARPVPLRYTLSVKTRLLVEPTTGAIVSLDRIDQTLNAEPDLTLLAPLLMQPELASIPAVKAATEKLTGSAAVPVFSATYGQTPASVAEFATYAESKAEDINTVKRTIPFALAGFGAIALLVALALAPAVHRRPPSPPPLPDDRPLAHAGY
jgi:hypothetical protein